MLKLVPRRKCAADPPCSGYFNEQDTGVKREDVQDGVGSREGHNCEDGEKSEEYFHVFTLK